MGAASKIGHCLLVTGGGRGIGAAVVRLAANKGIPVCFSFLQDTEAAAALASQSTEAGGHVRALQGDVADVDFARRLFDFAEDQFGTATMLVNNAGVTGPIGQFRDTTIDTLRQTVDTNLEFRHSGTDGQHFVGRIDARRSQ